MTSLLLSDVRFTPADRHEVDTGLIGYVSFVLNGGLALDGLTIRRKRTGERYLAYPARFDGTGAQHALVRPTCESVRRDLEREVFRALGFGEECR